MVKKLLKQYKKSMAKKYQEGDTRYNATNGRRERLLPDGTWKPYGASRRTKIAQAKYSIAKKKADKAGKAGSLLRKTIKEIPSTIKKPFKIFEGSLSNAFKVEEEQLRKNYRKATPEQIKIMKMFGKIK